MLYEWCLGNLVADSFEELDRKRRELRIQSFRQSAEEKHKEKNMAGRPNIILILSDDQGAWALGCAGNSEIVTPNLDRLSSEGVRFENFFCTSPVCSPARASILTGRMPSAHGVHDWIKCGNDRNDPIQYLAGQTCYTDLLAANGYHCMLSGKWHLGDSFTPQHGFREWYVHLKGSGDYNHPPMIRNGEFEGRDGYVTDLITDDAIENIRNHAGDSEPFYLSIHYTAPHSPWIDQHPKKYTDMYADCPFETCPQGMPHPKAVYRYDKDTARECLIGYFAAVTAMDAGIGRVIAAIEEAGIRENTFIIFLADNGFSCGHHGIWGKGNGTLDLNVYDTAVKVPCIVSWPAGVGKNKVCRDLFSQYDIFPTIMEVAGIDFEAGRYMPGKSFLPAVDGRDVYSDREVVVYDEYGPVRMIRSRRWKYVHRYPYGPHEFYDLEKDPNEDYNYIDDDRYSAVIAEMREKLSAWFVRYADPAVDGSREPVRGNGQLSRCGIYSEGQLSFDQDRKPTVSAKAGYG